MNHDAEHPPQDRRRFKRIPFALPAELSGAERLWRTQLVDICLKGALVTRPADWPETASGLYTLMFSLTEDGPTIRMDVNVAHIDKTHLRLSCNAIDEDSVGHLRRLVELNLGDASLMDRELSALISSPKTQAP